MGPAFQRQGGSPVDAADTAASLPPSARAAGSRPPTSTGVRQLVATGRRRPVRSMAHAGREVAGISGGRPSGLGSRCARSHPPVCSMGHGGRTGPGSPGKHPRRRAPTDWPAHVAWLWPPSARSCRSGTNRVAHFVWQNRRPPGELSGPTKGCTPPPDPTGVGGYVMRRTNRASGPRQRGRLRWRAGRGVADGVRTGCGPGVTGAGQAGGPTAASALATASSPRPHRVLTAGTSPRRPGPAGREGRGPRPAGGVGASASWWWGRAARGGDRGPPPEAGGRRLVAGWMDGWLDGPRAPRDPLDSPVHEAGLTRSLVSHPGPPPLGARTLAPVSPGRAVGGIYISRHQHPHLHVCLDPEPGCETRTQGGSTMAKRRFLMYLLFQAHGLAFGTLLLPPEGAPA